MRIPPGFKHQEADETWLENLSSPRWTIFNTSLKVLLIRDDDRSFVYRFKKVKNAPIEVIYLCAWCLK